ncbi:alpha/beta fold hydrolase [Sphingomonas alpina]|uniref:Alpha/beta hydrolase n=1 Tax=Sphingomonas alpina TaxID=653931 RepID=A0A7H0LP90_9SPHN|nr:alpha/beta hydrolase [Sphingomonas alpina]QNQ11493.1 alpha/beta hydrolase [Sphingomonas alpina]
MIRITLAALAALTLAASATAQVPPFPASFKTQEVSGNGATIHVRVGGKGPAVVLLHGYGETGDMWAPLAADLMRDHTLIVPDLRGLGLSSKPAGGFDKKTQAGDVVAVLDRLKVGKVDLVTHDIGNMVGFAFAALHSDRVGRFVLIDAPIPGVGPWEEILKNPLLWHFRFGGPDMERLVAGRERIYLDRFWNEFSATPASFTEGSRVHYAALYAMPGAMHSGFAQFAAFDQDAIDNRAWLAAKGKLTMPILALGGEKSFGPMMATVMRAGATNVTGDVVPGSGHWIMEENPAATVALVRKFLDNGAR